MKKQFLSIILPFTIVLLLSSCHNHKEGDGHSHGEAEEIHADEHGEEENLSSATLTAEQCKSINIQLGTIEKKQLTSSLKANGILKVPNQNRAHATAVLGGVVRSILAQTGNNVSKGQTLATIGNPEFVKMQEEYLSISSKAELATLDFERQQKLHEGNAGSLKNLQASEAELKGLNARKASLHKQLEMIGVYPDKLTSENMQSVVTITSPISGSVSDVMVNIGSYVDANHAIAEIVDNSQLHLDLYVYEKDLSKLRSGQVIHFTLTNNPGKEYDAKVFGISNTFEANTKAIAVHASVEGDKSGLIDGVSITALVSLDNATVDAIPTAAIVNHEGQDYIFIVADTSKQEDHPEEEGKHSAEEHGHQHNESSQTPEGNVTFEKIPVRKGTTDIGYSEITLLKDIPTDSKVVTNGAFFILAKMTNQGEAHEH